jgi:hypothetical protein
LQVDEENDRVIDEFHWENEMNKSRESFIGAPEPDMPLSKGDRRGTVIDVHMNDATLFNLGYTARITQVNAP